MTKVEVLNTEITCQQKIMCNHNSDVPLTILLVQDFVKLFSTISIHNINFCTHS